MVREINHHFSQKKKINRFLKLENRDCSKSMEFKIMVQENTAKRIVSTYYYEVEIEMRRN